MSDPAIGACVQYCGHDGYFVADIFKIGGVNVVKANGKVTPDNLKRPSAGATHLLIDFPVAGYWGADRGVFVVPCGQVRELAQRGEE